MISKLKKNNSRVSLFVEPRLIDIKISKYLNADCVEFTLVNFVTWLIKIKCIKKNLLKLKTQHP